MAAPDLSLLIPSINFSTTQVAVLASGAVLVGVYVVFNAVILVLGMVRGRVYVGSALRGQFYDRRDYEAVLSLVKKRIKDGELVDAESRLAVDRFEGLEKNRCSSSKHLSTRV